MNLDEFYSIQQENKHYCGFYEGKKVFDYDSEDEVDINDKDYDEEEDGTVNDVEEPIVFGWQRNTIFNGVGSTVLFEDKL